MSTSRRELLKLGAAVAGVMAVQGLGAAWGQSPRQQQRGEAAVPESTREGDMLYRKLGKTGEKVSLIGLGGFHIGTIKDETESIRLMRTAIDRGVTFMDNCWSYHNGRSEEWMGKALADGYRDKVFLMSKIDGQTKESAAKQIDESLRRLRTDRVDLMQHHEVIRETDPERILAGGGAREAMEEAKRAGKVRYLGFTGHKDPAIHLRMIEASAKAGYPIDAVQMPLNVLDAHYKSFGQQVLPVLVKSGTGVLAMKTLAAGNAVKSGAATAVECLQFAMNLPTSVVITGMESRERLDQALEAVRTFKPMSQEEVAALLAKTRELAQGGKFEPFKTTKAFDGTVHHPEWLG